ncbi:hypothetical protein HK102_001081 [Quaeritorhiza haematococci]|nr:hypothetical protein HK102_001081 [Quaeritorhiza haematococci]
MYFFFGVLWAIFFFNLVVYIYVGHVVMSSRRKFRRGTSNHRTPSRSMTDGNAATVGGGGGGGGNSGAADQTMLRYFRKTAFYMAAFFVNWSFGTINRIQNLIAPRNPIFVLFLLHATFTPLQGFLNSAVYFWLAYFKTKATPDEKESSDKSPERFSSTVSRPTLTRPGLITSAILKDMNAVPGDVIPGPEDLEVLAAEGGQSRPDVVAPWGQADLKKMMDEAAKARKLIKVTLGKGEERNERKEGCEGEEASEEYEEEAKKDSEAKEPERDAKMLGEE